VWHAHQADSSDGCGLFTKTCYLQDGQERKKERKKEVMKAAAAAFSAPDDDK
jgi:hypothetical protein